MKPELRLALATAAVALSGTASAAGYYVVTPSPGKLPVAKPPEIVVSLAPGTLAEAKRFHAYSEDLKPFLSVTGDEDFQATEASWSVTSGSLPMGLNLSVDGTISGTPTVASPNGLSFDVTASYKNNSGQQVYLIRVAEAIPLKARQVEAGRDRTCAITSVGDVKCWGWGSNKASLLPRALQGLTSEVTSVASSCLVTTVGGVKCWGDNLYGQLGNGTNTASDVPVDVVGLTSGVASISVNNIHACALTTSGGMKCWGRNDGQLGDGTRTDSRVPVDVTGLTSGVTSISTGNAHSCAVTTAGGVKCWGFNDKGQLGYGGTPKPYDYSAVPVNVTGLSSGVASVAGGGSHTCAVTTVGGVKCWGWNTRGELGNGTRTLSSVPVDVQGLSSGVDSVVAGSSFSCALTVSGGVKCWGSNYYGTLGNGSKTDSSVPVDVQGLMSGVVSLSSNGEHICALTTSGDVKCWGNNIYGQLGNGTTTESLVPVNVVE